MTLLGCDDLLLSTHVCFLASVRRTYVACSLLTLDSRASSAGRRAGQMILSPPSGLRTLSARTAAAASQGGKDLGYGPGSSWKVCVCGCVDVAGREEGREAAEAVSQFSRKQQIRRFLLSNTPSSTNPHAFCVNPLLQGRLTGAF